MILAIPDVRSYPLVAAAHLDRMVAPYPVRFIPCQVASGLNPVFRLRTKRSARAESRDMAGDEIGGPDLVRVSRRPQSIPSKVSKLQRGDERLALHHLPF